MKTKDPTCEFKDSTLTFALSAYARGCLLSVASSISLTVTFRRIVHSKREYLYSAGCDYTSQRFCPILHCVCRNTHLHEQVTVRYFTTEETDIRRCSLEHLRNH